jgi:acyl-CoA thioester hydrolase
MERARSEWLRSLGFEQNELRVQAGILFAVRRAEVDYLRPALFEDLLTVSVDPTRSGAASLDFQQEIRRAADDTLCCCGLVKVACVSAKTMRPNRIPEKLLEEIANVL